MTTIRFEVLGNPTGKGRPRATIRGRHAAMYTPEKTVNAERSFLAQALPYKPSTPLLGPLSVTIEAIIGVPESWSGVKKARAINDQIMPTGKPDCDNLAKLCLDSMNGVFYLDDKQVIDLHVTKRYGAVAKTVVTIRMALRGE